MTLANFFVWPFGLEGLWICCKISNLATLLRKEGLVVESLDGGEQKGMNFVRIVAPDDVLKRYAEILNLRLPMKKVSEKVCV